jgi:hypothetical protein
VTSVMALLLDLSNIVGGFLLSAALLRGVPRMGTGVARVAALVAPFAWVVGVVALVAGGYYLIVHVVSGPHVFHFEVVGIGVGVVLLWNRLTGRPDPRGGHQVDPTGTALLLAVFGLIAIVVGVQGLLTPDG